ncbi:hypothetical protein HPB48_016845 [Haemaphysalis longicornis]|uniref:Alpha-mannosidase n=1 Tax=Haemaphysalis longicornis TaxID=44386 RepID=A0A9J6FU07_HAELO|nr:hypothetical protein HPB48_016845 [Haemaphysalis longicornis]
MRGGWLLFVTAVASACLCDATSASSADLAPPVAGGRMAGGVNTPTGSAKTKPKPTSVANKEAKSPGSGLHCAFTLCPKAMPGVINIHFVPHSHMDVASQKVFDDNVPKASAILNSVSGELLKNKKRMFSVTEIALFKKWFEESNEVFKIIMKKFISEGRVELVNGGLVMNDEATTHYSDIIDQMTLGMRWINATFGPLCLAPRSLATGPLRPLQGAGFPLCAETTIFTSILPHRYNPPNVVNFRQFFLTEENKKNVAEAFLDVILTTGAGYRTDQRIVMFGDDYAYINATVWYVQMDTLISAINTVNGSRFHAFYSTPECYLRSVHDQWLNRKKALAEDALSFTGDFFPYSDRNFEWWTGFYSSKPQFKYLVRQASNVLQRRPLQWRNTTMASLAHAGEPLPQCRCAIQGAFTYSGTGTTAATNDFSKRIKRALAASEFYVSVYNPQSVMIKTHIRFPVATSGYRVINDQSAFVPSEIVPIQHALFHIPERNSTSFHDLVFLAALPPLGVANFLVQRFRGTTMMRQQIKASERVLSSGTDYILSNKWYRVAVDSGTCLLKRVTLLPKNEIVAVEQSFAAYNSEFGHYLFAPTHPTAQEFHGNATCRIVTSTVVQEVHQWFNPWLSQVIRLYINQDYIEFDWIVGPIPMSPSIRGYDVVTRFKSNLTNNGVFYTDSNGRQTLQRKSNRTRPWDMSDKNRRERALVQSNYYPVVSWIYLRDQDQKLQMSVLPDRPQGGTAYHKGTIELMVHRRFTSFDSKGTDQPLNDLGIDKKGIVVRGRHLLHLGSPIVASQRVRQLANSIVLAPLLTFSEATSPSLRSLETRSFRGLGAALPKGVQILTLHLFEPGKVLFRLEYMQPAVTAKETLTASIIVPLRSLMATYQLAKIRETTLTASRWMDEQPEPLQWSSPMAASSKDNNTAGRDGDVFDSDGLSAVVLALGEIRTFIGNIVRPK